MKTILIALLGALSATSLPAQSVRAIYPLHNGEELSVVGIARNGANVVLVGDCENQAFLWTGGQIQPFFLPGVSKIVVKGISGDGNVVVGEQPPVTMEDTNGNLFPSPNVGFVKVGSGAPVVIPRPAGYDWIEVRGVSTNGLRVLVIAHINDPTSSRPYLWSMAGGYEALGTFSDSEEPDPWAMNSNASVVAGSQQNVDSPVLWTAVGNWVAIGGNDWFRASVVGINESGNVLVGNQIVSDVTDRNIPWIWSGGTKTAIPTLAAGDSVYLRATASDCLSGVGSSYSSALGDRTAVQWSRGGGTRTLKDAFAGIDLSEWYLREATAVSSDGTVVTGIGDFNGTATFYVIAKTLTLPPGPNPPTPSPTPAPSPASMPKVGALAKKTSKPSVKVSGTAANATAVEFSVNRARSKTSPVRNGVFHFTATLKLGKNLIRFRAHGPGGNSSWRTIQVRRQGPR